MPEKEIVISLRLSEGSTREQFRALRGALLGVNQEISANNKALRENAAQQAKLAAEVKKSGVATQEQAVRERALAEQRAALVSDNTNLIASQAALSKQFKTSLKDFLALGDSQERLRDVFVKGTLEAAKQRGVIGQLGARMDFLATEQERLTSELKKGIITEEKYRQETQKVEQELRELGAQTTQLNGKIDLLTKEFKEGKITAEQFRASVAQINTSVTNVQGAITKGVADLKSYALGFVGVIAVATAAVAAIKSIGNTIADFDQQLANIRSLGKEFADSIDDISKAAIEMGPKLGVAPVEALKAFEALAKAGLTTSQILGGALQSTLTLAAAGTVEVGEAAETTAAALTQFNLAGEQAGLVTDLLAKGSNIAQGNVSDFAEALNQSGLVAAQFGLDIVETIGGLTAFAKAGLIGSDAGTSFRQALLRLQNPTEKAQKVMAQYGITVTNAAGEFLNLEEIAGQLQERLAGLTEEQRGAALATIFGQDAIRVANILYREGAEGVARYTREVNDSGFASSVASTKLDSLQGSVKLMSSAWDAFVLSIERGDGAIGKFLNTAINGVTKLLSLVTTDDIEKQAEDLGERVRKKFIATFNGRFRGGEFKLGFINESFIDIGQQLPEFDQAFEDEIKKINEAIGKGTDASKALIDAYGKEAKELAAIGKDVTNNQAFRFAVVSEAQELLTEQLAKRIEAEKKAAGEIAKSGQQEIATGQAVVEQTGERAKAVELVTGSISDLNDQIAKLREQQAQSTTSDQFNTYQAQIDKLTQSVDVLTGKLSQDMVDAANQVPQFLETRAPQTGKPDLVPAGFSDQQALQAAFDLSQEFRDLELENLESFLIFRNQLVQQFGEEKFEIINSLALREMEAQFAVDQAKINGIEAAGQVITQLVKEGSAAAKLGLALQKGAAIAQVFIAHQLAKSNAIAAATLAAATNPLIAAGGPAAIAALAAPTILASSLNAASSIAIIAAQAIAGFDEGGYTTSGPKHKPAGIVHAGEWVAPKWQVEDPVYGPIIDFLEGQRARRGGMSSIPFAGGGFTQTHGTALVNFGTNPSTGITAQRWSDLQALAIQSAASQQPIFVRVSDINKVQRMGRVTETLATG